MPPGETADLELALDPAGKFGETTKLLKVYSNDPASPVTELPVRAMVLHGVDPGSTLSVEEALFGQAQCARCHSAPARDLTGEALYEAVCEMCHGPLAQYAQSIPVDRRSREALHRWTAYGQDGTSMPGYLYAHGGPLSSAQVESLVTLMSGVVE